MTNILLLPIVQFETTATDNSDLLDIICVFQNQDTSPIDLTGIAFEAQIRLTALDPVSYVDASTANTQLIAGGPNGVLQWNIPLALMQKLTGNQYVTDIRAYADGHTLVIAQGTFTVTRGVTR